MFGPDDDISLRQHHIDFDPELYDLKIEILESVAERDPQAKEAFDKITSSTKVADLGTGSGYSSIAISDMCPDLQELAMVDVKDVISTDISSALENKGIKVDRKPNTTIQNYLLHAENGRLDMVFLGNVINHSLKEEDYRNLHRIVADGGIVFETDQTALNRNEMSKFFEVLYERKGAGYTTDTIWKKKQI